MKINSMRPASHFHKLEGINFSGMKEKHVKILEFPGVFIKNLKNDLGICRGKGLFPAEFLRVK